MVQLSHGAINNLEKNAPKLWRKVLLSGVGHWTEQKDPEDVKHHVLEVLVAHR